MSITPIQADSFTAFVKTLEGQEITSRAGRSKFTVCVNGDDMVFTPLSTNKPRSHPQRYVESVLNQFNRTRSYVLKDYRDNGIVNATYMLTLIDLYQNHNSNRQSRTT